MKKQIFLLNISSPIFLTKSDIVDIKLIICEHIKNDEFISIAKNINLRVTPELTFELDNSYEQGMKIEGILQSLKDENGGI